MFCYLFISFPNFAFEFPFMPNSGELCSVRPCIPEPSVIFFDQFIKFLAGIHLGRSLFSLIAGGELCTSAIKVRSADCS